MLSLDDLISFAKQVNLPQQKRRGIVREYLQTLVLYYLQQTSYASKLIFIGGTALRFFHNLQRFSEDLDFNYLGVMSKKDIQKFMEYLHKELEKENIQMEYSIRKSRETYFHWKVYMQFLNILQEYKCGGRINSTLHPTEKLSIQLDIQNLHKKNIHLLRKLFLSLGKDLFLMPLI